MTVAQGRQTETHGCETIVVTFDDNGNEIVCRYIRKGSIWRKTK